MGTQLALGAGPPKVVGPPVLLVTGARALVDLRGGEAWVRHALWQRLRPYADGNERRVVVVTGDARGPDTWALDVAREFGCRALEYATDSYVYEQGVRVARWTKEDPPDPGDSVGWRRWPVWRDNRMVSAVSVAKRQGRRIAIAAFYAGEVREGGTGHTVRYAVASGISVKPKDEMFYAKEVGGTQR